MKAILVFLFLINFSQAQTLQQQLQKNQDKVSYEIFTGVTTDFKEQSSKEKQNGANGQLFIRYKKYTLFTTFNATERQEDDVMTGDTQLITNLGPIVLSNAITYIPTVSAIFATSKVSRDRDNLNGAIQLNSNFVFSKPFNGILDAIIFNPRVRKNFHTYTTNEINQNVSSYTLQNLLVISKNITKSVNFSSVLLYSLGWSYENIYRDPQYATIQTVAYNFDNYALELELATTGKVTNPEKGKKERVEIYDADSSTITFGMRARF